MADGTIIINTTVDNSGAEKGIKSLTAKLGGLAKGGLSVLAKGVAVAGTALSTAGVASIKLASDLSEVQNVVDVTFGENAKAINDWSKKAATSFGMSELQAKQFNGTIGAMFKSMGLGSQDVLSMSQGITGLAGDFASFYNLKPEEAFEKLRSGISGETEPLKQLGINMSVANLEAFAMSQGMNKAYKDMTQAEQATLRYNYLLSVSKDAQGDFARTSDSLANQLRIAKLNITDLGSSIGETLIPAAKDAVSSINGMVGELKNAFTQGGFAGLAGALGNVLSEIITQIAAQLPNIVNMGVQIIQSLITGIQNNLPLIALSTVQIVSSLVNGILTMLPQLLQIGMQCIVELANGIALQLPTLIPTMVQCVMTIIQTIVNNLPAILNAGMNLLDKLVEGIINAIPILVNMLPQIINTIVTFIVNNLPLILNMGLKILLALINGIVNCLPQLIAMLPRIITTIISVLISHLPQIIQTGIKVLIALINGLVNALPQLISMLPTIINTIVNTLAQHLPEIIKAGIQIIVMLSVGLIKAIPKIIAAIPSIVSAIFRAFTSVNWGEIGLNIIKGIGSGIGQAAGWLWRKAKGVVKGVKDKMCGFLGIHSPSRLMRDLVGVNIVKGIGVGMDKETPNLNDMAVSDMQSLYKELRGTVDSETAKTTAAVASNTIINNNSVVNNNTDTEKTNTQVVKNYYVDGKEFMQVLAPYADEVMENWRDGR